METETAPPKITNFSAIGFLGLGHIGLSRLESAASLLNTRFLATDIHQGQLERAQELLPTVIGFDEITEMLELGKPEAVVVSTPNFLHAPQCISILDAGIPVFCQKPLGRNLDETRAIISKAREMDLLLGVDFTYRHSCFRYLKPLLDKGDIGEILAVEMVFHNAYGPEKEWFYNKNFSGGGCLLDLGIHLLDMLLWLTDCPPLRVERAKLYSNGRRTEKNQVEDFAWVNLSLQENIPVSLSCSWKSSPGAGADIRFYVMGSREALLFRNVNGSFYEFETLRFTGDRRETIAVNRGSWGGEAIGTWLDRLSISKKFDNEIVSNEKIARIIDDIYHTAVPD